MMISEEHWMYAILYIDGTEKRTFARGTLGICALFHKRSEALLDARALRAIGFKAAPVRVRVHIEQFSHPSSKGLGKAGD